MKKKLIRLCLNKEFYETNKSLLIKELFPEFLALFYDALVFAHKKYKRTISLTELEQLIYAGNPLLTEAQKALIQELCQRIAQEPEVGPDVAQDVLKAIWKEETGRRISKAGIDLIEGKGTIQDVQRLVESIGETFLPEEDIEETTKDVDAVLAELDKRTAWKFNIPALNDVVPGISEGELAVVFARPESGKTAWWVSSVCGPNGFTWQGARVMVLCNEEPSIRTMLRCISAASGLNKEEIRKDRVKAKEAFNQVNKNLMIFDDVTMTTERLDALVRNKRPDILIIDQLDKLYIEGAFMRTDERLGAIYQRAREVAKIRHCAVIGLTQASADAEGRTQLHYSMMAESKTSKAAEADLIIGIGRAENLQDPVRFLTLSKNKISGYHGTVNCMLRAEVSRFIA